MKDTKYPIMPRQVMNVSIILNIGIEPIISVLELVQLHYVIIKGILTSAILIIILRHYVWNMLIIKKAIKSVLWKILRISRRLLRIL